MSRLAPLVCSLLLAAPVAAEPSWYSSPLMGTPHRIVGVNQAVGTTQETIWPHSTGRVSSPTAAQTLTLSSSSASDTAAGTGCRTAIVEYLDSGLNAVQTAELTLNGQTGVTVGTGLRVQRFWCGAVGSGLVNAGILYVGYGTITTGVPATILDTIPVGEGRSTRAFWTVPAGRTADLERVCVVGFSITGYMQLFVWIRPPSQSWQLIYYSPSASVSVSETCTEIFGVASLVAGTDIEVGGDTTASNSSAGVDLLINLR